MTIERFAEIDRPVADVYALLADDTRLTEWREDLVSSERVSPPGPIDGAEYRETLRTPLGARTATVRLSTEPLKHFSFEVLDGPIRPRGSLVLQDLGAKTSLTYRVELKPLMKIETPIDKAAGAFLARSVERSMEKLKAILEG